jgi:replicative DNA helicase
MAVDQQQQRAPTVPPHDLDAEESVLGAMLVSANAIAIVSEVLQPEDFYRRSHATIYETILRVYAEGGTVDSITLINSLQNQGQLDEVGGKAAVHTRASTVPAVANAHRYAEIVRDASTYRNLIRAGTQIAQLGYERLGEPQELVDQAEQVVFGIADQRITSDFFPIAGLLNDSFERISQLHESGREITGVGTGFRKLDKITAGLQPSNLVILAARPGMGKTSLALGMARNVATQTGRPVVFFSMEMGALELTKRLLAMEAGVDATRLWTAKLTEPDWGKISHAVGRLAEAQLHIDDNPHCTVMEMRAKARRLRARHGDLGLVVVDYIQLMTPSSTGRRAAENRQVEVSEISRGLKILARELECPVIALSQLNRQLEYRQDKRPMLADLRESGGLEQDADVVAFIYRDEVYNPESDDRALAEIIIAKHRNGPTGTARLVFRPERAEFVNMAHE